MGLKHGEVEVTMENPSRRRNPQLASRVRTAVLCAALALAGLVPRHRDRRVPGPHRRDRVVDDGPHHELPSSTVPPRRDGCSPPGCQRPLRYRGWKRWRSGPRGSTAAGASGSVHAGRPQRRLLRRVRRHGVASHVGRLLSPRRARRRGRALDATAPRATPWARFVARRHRGSGASRAGDRLALRTHAGGGERQGRRGPGGPGERRRVGAVPGV